MQSTFSDNNNNFENDVKNKAIETLLESVNVASQHVRNYYIAYLFAAIFICTIIWSSNDLMLLKDTPVKIPLLEVELSITGFYWFAPYLIYYYILTY